MNVSPRLIEIFLEVAKIEGLSGNEKAIADYIKSFLEKLGLAVMEDDTAQLSGGNCGNLICNIGSGGNFALLAHMDTARSTGNLKAVVTADRICSDGSTILGADNRAGVAVILYTIENTIRNNIPHQDFTAAFTVCEETTLIGSQNLSLDKNIEMAFVFDSSKRPGHFISQSYGAQRFTINIIGKASHSGVAPEKGVSSISAAAKAIANLQFGRIDEITTANIGKISGGTATNVVPEKTVLEGEVRSLNPENVEIVVANIEREFRFAADYFGAILEFESNWDFKPYRLTPDMAIYQRIETAIAAAGLSPKPSTTPGGSDANSLNGNDLPAVNIGIGAQNPHANDEFILLEDLQKSVEIAMALIRY